MTASARDGAQFSDSGATPAAGDLAARVAVITGPAIVVIAAAAAVLTMAGAWNPWTAWPTLAVAVSLAAWATRGVRLRCGPELVVLAGLIAIWHALFHSQHVIITRDPGAYALYTQWITTRGGLPVDADLAAFGGPSAFQIPGFTLDAPAFYEVLRGSGAGLTAEVVPQFLIGAPAVFSFGWWSAGPFGSAWTGLFVMPALLTFLALVAFGTLATELLGRRPAILAVLLLGLAVPVLVIARSTYSESVALAVLMSTACLLVAALRRGAPRAAQWGLVVGLTLGLAALVRVDAVRESALVIAVCVFLAVRGNPAAIPIMIGSVVGSAVSVVGWWTMSAPYIRTIWSSVRPLLIGATVIIVIAAVLVPLARRRRRRPAPDAASLVEDAGLTPSRSFLRWWQRQGAWERVSFVAVLVLGVLLASRPAWFMSVQESEAEQFVASLQRGQGLPIDGRRLYAEYSLNWLAWSLGWAAVVLGWVALAVVAARAAAWWRSGLPWPPVAVVPAAVGFASMLLVLWRPGITPDHPWADRRLVPVVLPTMVLASVAALTWLVQRIARRWRFGERAWVVPLLAMVTLVVPVLWGALPLALLRTEAGEVAAVAEVCASLPRNAVVVTVDGTDDGHPQRSGNEWPQVIRGVCDRPAAALNTPLAQLPDAVTALADQVAAAGGQLVLLTAQERDSDAQRVLRSAAPQASATQAVYLQTVEHRKLLNRMPLWGNRLIVDVWIAPIPG